MITFEELTNQTYAVLLEKEKNRSISVNAVKGLLENMGLKEALQQIPNSDSTNGSSFTIRRIDIRGTKWPNNDNPAEFIYRRDLYTGINAWIADNSSGKSTILKVILWAITGIRPNIKQDMLLWMNSIAVELEIANEIYTIRYTPRSQEPVVVGEIFKTDLDTVLAGKDLGTERVSAFSGAKEMASCISRLFEEKTNFFPLQMAQKTNNAFDLTEGSVNWNTYAQALFIGADDYSDFLFPRKDFSAKQRQRTLWMFMGLSLSDVLSSLQLERDKAKNNLDFEKKRVEINAKGIKDKIQAVEKELSDIEKRIAQIDGETSIFIDPVYVEQVRGLVAEADDEVIRLSNIEQDLVFEENETQLEINELRRLVQELKEGIEFKVFLSGLVVDRCPHCENSLPMVKVEEEIKSGQCRVCHGALRPLSSVTSQEMLLKEYEGKLEKVKSEQKRLSKETKKVHAQLLQAQNQASKYKLEFNDLSRQERDGFSHEMRTLLEMKGNYLGQLAYLKELTTESQAQHLMEITGNYLILSTATKVLHANIDRKHEDILRRLNTLTTSLAQSFGVQNLSEISLRDQSEMFVVQSGKNDYYPKLDSGEQLRIKIAFHLAMMLLKVELSMGNHPSILIIDAPGAAEMTEKYLAAILNGFAAIESKYAERVQVLIATTHKEISGICQAEKLEIVDGPMF